MKNIIRFAGFVLALFFAANLSAQTTAPIKASSSQQFVSSSDNVTIDVIQGPVSYWVYVQKLPEAPMTLVVGHRDTHQDATYSFPGSYRIQVILSTNTVTSANVIFND
jgi:hypothetical protein